MLSFRKLDRSLAAVFALVLVAGCSGRSSGSGGSSSTAPAATVTPAATGTGAATATPAATTPTPPPAPTFSFGTRKAWPLVLVHGICGWKQIGSIDYFYGVPKVLRDQGFEVLVTEAPPVGLVEERARKIVDQILAAYPDPRVKVNIIAHSMGGLDARHAITGLGLGPRVASLTTVATPHRGSTLCDVSTALVPNAFATSSIAFLGSIGIDIRGAFELTTTNIQQSFNPRTPDDPRVAYFSWAG